MAKPNRMSGGTEISPSTMFSTKYSGEENRMTRALLQVIHAGGIDLIWHIAKSLDIDVPDSYLRIVTQTSGEKSENSGSKSVFDGKIALYPLEIIIESKVNGNHIDEKQLDKYIDYIDHRISADIDARLVYITSDLDRPGILEKDRYLDCVIWCPWEDIFKYIENFPRITSQLRDMVEGLKGLYDEINKIPLQIPNDKLVAVLAGRIAYPRAVEKNIYNCQPGRTFRNARYFAFYADRKIEKVFEVVEGPLGYNEEFGNLPETDDYYRLKPADDVIAQPIINDDRDERGNLRPITMGMPRYVNIDTLSKAKTITQLKTLNNLN